MEIAESVPCGDSNYAEYAALLAALRYATGNGHSRLEVFSDSEVLVKQISGRYSCHSATLRNVYETCRALIGSLDSFAISHIRRENNLQANRLANLAAERKSGQPGKTCVAFAGASSQ